MRRLPGGLRVALIGGEVVKHIVLILVLSVLSLLPPLSGMLLSGDEGGGIPFSELSDAELDGLTAEEKTYVRGVYKAGTAAQLALMEVISVDEELGNPYAMEDHTELDLLDAVTKCQKELTATAGAFRQSAPDSMQGIGKEHADMANLLDGSFSSCLPMLRGEVRGQLAGSLPGSFGFDFLPPGPEEQQRAVDLARARACARKEAEEYLKLLEATEMDLNAAIKDVQDEQAVGEALLDAFLNDQCFIATAAYGTSTAAEIDVLRDFRDEVLLLSPAGCDLVGFYYVASPPIADFIARQEALRTVVREGVVDPIVRLVSLVEPLWQTG